MKISLTELLHVLDMRAERVALLVEREQLRAQILELLAGDAALSAQVTALYAKSEAVEAKMRAGAPPVPHTNP